MLHFQLGACNPGMAYEVVEADWQHTVLLPCHISIIERSANETQVCFIDPTKMFGAFLKDNKALQSVADDADQRFHRVME